MWAGVLADLAISPESILRAAGLPMDLMSHQDAWITPEEYFAMWRALEAAYTGESLPARVANAMTSVPFSPPLFAALCSPNLSIGVQRVSVFKRLIGPMALDVEVTTDGLRLAIRWVDTTTPPPDSLVHTELAVLVTIARIGASHHIVPARLFTSNPPVGDHELIDFFGVEPEQSDDHAVVFRLADAYRPFVTANETMWSVFEPDLRRRLADLDAEATIIDRVQAVLREHLPSGRGHVNEVADRLAMSSRTLQRKLSASGTTFQSILRSTRTQLAEHYLKNSALSGTEISYLLGFEDSNSFFRAFIEWTGSTPGAARERFLAGVGAD